MAETALYKPYLIQGVMHLYRSKGGWYRFQFTYADPVDPQLMQQALERIQSQSEYFRMWFEKGLPDVMLTECPEPAHLWKASDAMPYPAEPQGELFYVSYEDASVYFDWHHFLTDGYGAARFMTQLSAVYCGLRYGAPISETPLVTAAPYALESLLQETADIHPAIPPLSRSSEMTETEDRYLVRISKPDLVREALAQGVKPFSFLMAVLCRVIELCRETETITYGFTVNAREAIHAENALYNVSFGYRREVASSAGDGDTVFVKQLDADIKYLLQPDIQRCQFASFIEDFDKLHRMKAPPRIKRRVQEMAESATGGTLDLFVSYVGNPLKPDAQGFREYIKDAQFWFSEQSVAALGMDIVSIGGNLNLCVADRMGCPSSRENIRKAFEAAGIACCFENASNWFS